MSDIVQVVTDSSTDVPSDMARQLGITVVPCLVRFGDEFYREDVDLSRESFYARLQPGRVATSQPSVGVFQQVYRQAVDQGRRVVSVHSSSRLSGIHDTACSAAREMPQGSIDVIDSRSASLGAGLMTVAAADAARRGESLESIAQIVRDMADRVRVMAVLDTLDYVGRGGRVAWALAMLGSLLSIKPLVALCDGRVDLVERARTLPEALRRLAQRVRGLGPLEQLWIMHARASGAASRLAELLTAVLPRDRMVMADAGMVITAHVGPGAVGVACLVGPRS